MTAVDKWERFEDWLNCLLYPQYKANKALMQYNKLIMRRKLEMSQFTEDGSPMTDKSQIISQGRQLAADICREASEAIGPGKAREKTHGRMETSFQTAANMISDYLHHPVTAPQVAGIMIMLKMSRIATGDAAHKDHYTDIAGYAGLMGALALSDPPPAAPSSEMKS